MKALERYFTSLAARLSPLAPVGGTIWAASPTRNSRPHRIGSVTNDRSGAMDFSTEAQITAKVTAFAQDKTVVLVTHRTSMLAMITRVIVIDGGKVVADGPRERIMEALASGRVARAA